MPNRKNKTCHIVSSAETDTSLLRQVLDEKGVRWSDLTNVRHGLSWLRSIEGHIDGADFVCAVLLQRKNEELWFELGVASVKRKPILLLVDSSMSVPSDLVGLVYFRTDLSDVTSIEAAVSTFLKNIKLPDRHEETIRQERHARTGQYITLEKRGKAKSSGKPISRKREFSVPENLSSLALEKAVATLFQDAGFIVSEQTSLNDKAVDFAVWIDRIESYLGNPVLVEVKSGRLSGRAITKVGERLRELVAKSNSGCGLVVYEDQDNLVFPRISAHWPIIFYLNASTVISLIQSKKLSSELIRLRNAAIHREV